jgi:hypothetical protein
VLLFLGIRLLINPPSNHLPAAFGGFPVTLRSNGTGGPPSIIPTKIDRVQLFQLLSLALAFLDQDRVEFNG